MLNLTRVLATIAVALLAGSYFNGAYIIVPAQRDLSASTYIEVEQANTTVGHARFPILVFSTMLLQAALLVQLRPAARMEFSLTLLGLLLTVAATVITVRWVVPINTTVHGWNPVYPPADWKITRLRWAQLHVARTACVCAALVLQVLALPTIKAR